MNSGPISEDDDVDGFELLSLTIGTRIRRFRMQQGLAQKELAKRATSAVGLMFEIERTGANFSLKTLYKIATALGVTIADLLPYPVEQRYDEEEFQRLTDILNTFAETAASSETSAVAQQAMVQEAREIAFRRAPLMAQATILGLRGKQASITDVAHPHETAVRDAPTASLPEVQSGRERASVPADEIPKESDPAPQPGSPAEPLPTPRRKRLPGTR